ncbi:hypothetical protein Sgly_1721 [Syntrophobotulus glycolicus DSM 8271]|uniref:Uncharacterized protein n=1 Tax=Syntrophobotulus glycolicus (strain DSM 8271 / FlGlyR) TaxID=645991 RepID=F0SYY1_SYNGF|nr:hypothetical protein [Syntrophobotulus glycolicus]ADY56018.1 hypothetical protein Sgly_1721 [Syntrophobotulus glycolicus DSM 8271]
MAKYHIFGIRRNQSMPDIEFKLLKAFGDDLTPELEEKETGNIIVYRALRYAVSEDFRMTYGDFGDYIFIKETVLDIIKNKLNIEIIGTVEEEDIPKRAGILVKL